MAAKYAVILHLGAHKTGTSVLQKYMRDRPREMAGYRARMISRTDTNHLIGWGSKVIEEPELLRAAVTAAGQQRLSSAVLKRIPVLRSIAGPMPRTVIVSHENSLGRPVDPDGDSLYPFAEARANALKTSVGMLKPRAVFYLRSQEQFLESYYLQTVHQGSTLRFRQWLESVNLDAASWVPVIEKLAAAFGDDHVVVRDFAEIKQGQNQFIENFLRICDPSLNPSVDYGASRNLSVSARGLEVALATNPYLETPAERKASRVFLQANFNNSTGARPELFTEQEKAELKQRYGAENQELLARFADPVSGPVGLESSHS